MQIIKRKIIFFFIVTFTFCSVREESYPIRIENSINELRNIRASQDKEILKKHNSTMDENWKLYSRKKGESIVILKKILADEVNSKNPNHLVLLDLGYYISLNDSNFYSNTVILNAYKLINISEEVISQNTQEFFHFSMLFSEKQLPNFLSLLEERYVKSNSLGSFYTKDMVFVNLHAQRTHLFGVYGNLSIKYLLDLLKLEKNETLKRSYSSILRRICDSSCAQDVFTLLNSETDHETFVNETYIMLDNAGPKGRELYLKLEPKNLSEKTKDYFNSEQEYVRKMSYDFLLKKLISKYGNTTNKFSDNKVLDEIDQMIANRGASKEIHPMDILNSRLDINLLITKLVESRRQSFKRINRQGFMDIDITNMILNILYYKKESLETAI